VPEVVSKVVATVVPPALKVTVAPFTPLSVPEMLNTTAGGFTVKVVDCEPPLKVAVICTRVVAATAWVVTVKLGETV